MPGANVHGSNHGPVDLEPQGDFGLPDDIDDSFTTTIDLVTQVIRPPRSTIGPLPSTLD